MAAMLAFAGALLGAAAGVAQISHDPISAGLHVSRTYVLSQAYCLPPQIDPQQPGQCKAQDVHVGAKLAIQLPGTPAVWTLVSVSPNLSYTGTTRLPNQGRIAGTSEIFVFEFEAVRGGDATIEIREFPPAISASASGSFSYPIHVK